MGMRFDMIEYVEIESKTPAKHTVIWLHGLGADGQDFVPIVPELKLPNDLAVRFIFPHATIRPVTINAGYEMRAWYDIAGIQLDAIIDREGILASAQMIEELIAQENSRGVPTENIILGGFSQGAVMALTIGLRRATPLAGIVALSGYFPLADETLAQTNNTVRDTPIFLAHGTQDFMVPFALGQMSYQLLKEAHCQVSWHAYPMGHAVCGEEIRDIGEWISSEYKRQTA